MGLWDKVKNQFIDVIEWQDDSSDTIVWKFPHYDNEIKNGAQLIVREGQAAVFLHEGQIGDVFTAGRHELSTNNIPILTTLGSWKYAFDAPFKCDIFFVSVRQFTDLKWGTKNPIMLRDPEFGPIRLRAFGSYCFKISDPGVFIKGFSGSDSLFTTDEISDQFRNILISRFTDTLGESKIPALDLAANYNEFAEELMKGLAVEFEEYGTTLTKFLIENISLPPAVEEALDKRSSMGIIGNLQQYTQYQTANAIEGMAENQGGGGNMMGMVAGMNMGGVMGNTMQQAAAAPPPQQAPVPQAVQWFAAFNGQQSGPFDPGTVQQQVQQGNISKETLMWKQGMANWLPASDVPEVSAFFGSAPPPIPPPPPQ
ncbi:MAG: SPFH domain-containing protein [Lentisphaeria bacterium]|nr:SPFH domain-containing protein [Lentisphaeria bacterium]